MLRGIGVLQFCRDMAPSLVGHEAESPGQRRRLESGFCARLSWRADWKRRGEVINCSQLTLSWRFTERYGGSRTTGYNPTAARLG